MSLIVFSFFYNRSKAAHNSISSLLESAPSDAKVVLVDDGSTDDTLKELQYFSYDKRVSIVSQHNMGFSKSLRYVIPEFLKENQYKYLAIHGSGDLCKQDKFSKQLEYLTKNEDIVALGTGYETVSNRHGNLLRVDSGFVEASIEDLYQNVPFTHGTVVYRTDAFVAAGGYDETFKYCQDWNLYFELIKYGRIVRHPCVLYTKFIFEDGASFKPSKRLEQLKYRKLVLSRKQSECFYKNKLKEVKALGISEAYPDSCFINDFKKSRRSLIVKGELELALEWNDFIPGMSKLVLIPLLKTCIFLKFPSQLIPLIYANYIKVKKWVSNLC